MNNRNFPPGPFPGLSPELLAQIAASAFRPPAPMNAPSLPSAPHVRGMSLGEGFKLLNEGLDKWLAKPPPSPAAPRLMAGVANVPSANPQPLPPVDFLTGLWERQWGNFRA